MASTPVRSIGVLGIVGLMALMLLMLMSLGSMTDSAAAGMGKELHRAFARSLVEDSATTRISMRRQSGAVKGARQYTIVLFPSEAVSSDERACSVLLSRAAEFVGTRISGKSGEVVALRCVADRGPHGQLITEFVRRQNEHGVTVSPVGPKLDDGATDATKSAAPRNAAPATPAGGSVVEPPAPVGGGAPGETPPTAETPAVQTPAPKTPADTPPTPAPK